MSDDSPPLLRPTPRRPFEINFPGLTTPSPSSDDPPSPHLPLADPSHLTPSEMHTAGSSSSLSRPPSMMNLTASTLFGIYSPTTTGRRERDDLMDTPWGTGAQTPVRRPALDEATYELMKERSHMHRRRSSYKSVDSNTHLGLQQSSTVTTVASLTFRGGLLFALGVGYGALVSRFHRSPEGDDYLFDHVYFLAFWGVAGVVLGALLPWFDKIWEDAFGEEDRDEAVPGSVDVVSGEETNPGTDWALVMRAIGAFVGIVFAIRKLPWSSTLQVSITLALVNPLLWWLIDRSKAGFLLSSAVGLAGSILLLGVNPAMMPTPSVTSALFRNNESAAAGSAGVGAGGLGNEDDELMMMLGGYLAKNETVEAGVWMLSVLFCSCVCFGNIGRRLAWGPSAVVKGRWGDVR